MSTGSFDPAGILSSEDVAFIKSSGRDPDQVLEQLEFLRKKRAAPQILRPATIGDGIHQFESYDVPQLTALHADAAGSGRLTAFVPASGSGTRLFQNLLELHRNGETDIDQIRRRAAEGHAASKDALVALENFKDFAIGVETQKRGAATNSVAEILQALFDDDEYAYQELPKGLIPFHRYDDHVRTAFVEHLYEAAALATDKQNICRVHFTISPAHRSTFEKAWQKEQPQIENALGVTFQVEFSEQSQMTDTVAVDLDGKLRRDRDGHIVFRPGGHGALLVNLAASNVDVALIKNIDNITHDHARREIVNIRKLVCGLLLFFEAKVHNALREIRESGNVEPALELLSEVFGRKPKSQDAAERKDYALDQLNRPLRVCGVVRTLEHAGGRPFWLDDPRTPGPWLQIVEGAELDLNDETQRELFNQSRHFSTVEIAASLRDVDGQPFELKRFAMPARALVASKVIDGVQSLLYEHPGLWNGSMGLWNTIFVEIPDYTFHPVKTISDLHDPGHRA